jgi:hypothetical protein
MRRLLPALSALLFAAAASALEADRATRDGYDFDNPRILAQQGLFGIAHGVGLLAAACRNSNESAAAEAAYADWQARQTAAIDAARRDLGLYYFGRETTTEEALVQKMSLREALQLDAAELQAACATFPAALRKQRYDLAARLRIEELMALTVAATTVEARERHCRELFSEPLRQVHDARFEAWREINAPVLAQTNAELAKAWPEEAPAASFDDWYAELRRTTHAGGDLAHCIAFSESLKRPEAALRNTFRMPSIQRDNIQQ